MRKKIVAGNWKMNGNQISIQHLLSQISEMLPEQPNCECIVIPPVIYIPLVQKLLHHSFIKLGAQNVCYTDSGAYTGEISALMLKEYDCRYVLVGHSERRNLFAEDEKIIAEKFHHIKERDMIPVLCLGESLSQREKGLTEQVIEKQVISVIKRQKDKTNCFSKSVIAYEPVWAIGTGLTADPDEVQKIHQFIRTLVAQESEEIAAKLPILYGGSVNEKNAGSLFAMPDVDGGLIGGASLNAQQFVEIVKCIK